MTTTYREFALPFLPTSKNQWQRMHWTNRGRIKRLWEQCVWAEVNRSPRVERPATRAVVDVLVGWDKPGPLPDPQNVNGMAHECIADGLVKAGIIADDSKGQYVEGTTQFAPEIPGKTKVLLRLEYE